jgi:hypothetical protein
MILGIRSNVLIKFDIVFRPKLECVCIREHLWIIFYRDVFELTFIHLLVTKLGFVCFTLLATILALQSSSSIAQYGYSQTYTGGGGISILGSSSFTDSIG